MSCLCQEERRYPVTFAHSLTCNHKRPALHYTVLPFGHCQLLAPTSGTDDLNWSPLLMIYYQSRPCHLHICILGLFIDWELQPPLSSNRAGSEMSGWEANRVAPPFWAERVLYWSAWLFGRVFGRLAQITAVKSLVTFSFHFECKPGKMYFLLASPYLPVMAGSFLNNKVAAAAMKDINKISFGRKWRSRNKDHALLIDLFEDGPGKVGHSEMMIIVSLIPAKKVVFSSTSNGIKNKDKLKLLLV